MKKEKEGDTQAGAGGNQARNGRLTPKSETGWVRSEEDDKNWKGVATKTIESYQLQNSSIKSLLRI